jgi:predicted 3-demethylubiquinone-9 3-methyltransferase (glyoxalase superfamily)
MQRIVPHLWFDKEAKDAAEWYTSVFGGDSKILSSSVLSDTPSGSVDIVSFSLWGYEFSSISAGPLFKFNPSISISVQCKDEPEIDRLYAALSEGGKVLMELDWYPWDAKYVWLSDRYGVSWQLNFFKDQGMVKDRISPAFLFTKDKAGKTEEAMNFYASVFPDSSIGFIARYEEGESATDAPGTVKHAEFRLCNQGFMALDSAAAHEFVFNEAVSLMVRCDTQEEIDRYFTSLSAVPEAEQCGWLKDKYGVSWQIVPTEMDEMMRSGTKEQIGRVTEAFLKMKKFDLAVLRKAYEGV